MKCSIENHIHGNCPSKPIWATTVDDKDCLLCEKCFKNVKAGAYGNKISYAFRFQEVGGVMYIEEEFMP